MNTLDSLIKRLELSVAAGSKRDFTKSFNGCYIGDILSKAMLKCGKNNVWITCVPNENAAAVAVVAQAACIILADGILPENTLTMRCREYNIPLFLSRKSAYELACEIAEAEYENCNISVKEACRCRR